MYQNGIKFPYLLSDLLTYSCLSKIRLRIYVCFQVRNVAFRKAKISVMSKHMMLLTLNNRVLFLIFFVFVAIVLHISCIRKAYCCKIASK